MNERVFYTVIIGKDCFAFQFVYANHFALQKKTYQLNTKYVISDVCFSFAVNKMI